MPIETFPRSRLQFASSVIVNGVETFGRWAQPSFLADDFDPALTDSFLVTNDTNGRPDRIAGKVYGDPFLDWVIIGFNKPREVLNWPRSGQIIRYPIASAVLPQLV